MNGLEVEGLVSGYGDARVLHGVDIDVGPGEIVAVVGANGAGKTTLFRTIAGLLPALQGQIRFAGERIDGRPSHRRVMLGVALVPEGRLVFPDLSVADNLRIGAINPRARIHWRQSRASIYERFPRLYERRNQPAATLSGGEQQMLALGRGLMAKPRLLLLDEPTLGLAPAIIDQVFSIIPTLVASGVMVMMAEQNVERTLALADRCYVLASGRVTASGTATELRDRPQLRAAFFGA